MRASAAGVDAPGGIVAAPGGIVSAAGGIVSPAGEIVAAAGEIVAAKGGTVAAAGEIVAAKGGTVAAASGIVAAAGEIVAATGGTVAAAGGIVAAKGGAVAAAGNIAAAGGIVGAAGGIVTAAGGIVTAAGGIVGADGRPSSASPPHASGRCGSIAFISSHQFTIAPLTARRHTRNAPVRNRANAHPPEFSVENDVYGALTVWVRRVAASSQRRQKRALPVDESRVDSAGRRRPPLSAWPLAICRRLLAIRGQRTHAVRTAPVAEYDGRMTRRRCTSEGRRTKAALLAIAASLCAVACTGKSAAPAARPADAIPAPAAAARPVPAGPAPSFRDAVLPVFFDHCTEARGCHGAQPAHAVDLDLRPPAAYRQLVNVAAEDRVSAVRVKPGAPDASFLVDKLTGKLGRDEGRPMPLDPITGRPTLPSPLPPRFVDDVLRPWIAAGAPDN